MGNATTINTILKVQILLSRHFVVIAQAPIRREEPLEGSLKGSFLKGF